MKITLIQFNVIAFTHAGIGLKELGNFHLDEEAIAPKMKAIKAALGISEIMYLSTCNRVEFSFVIDDKVDLNFIKAFVGVFNPEWDEARLSTIAKKARYWNGINAVNHLIEVASSLDSMVLGEREIITQVRNAYDFSRKMELSGDIIRIVIRQTIETAKKVYTQTSIAKNSVSIVSLAYQQLMKHNIQKNARFIIIGSGVTNQNICKFLKKDGFTNFTIFNRTLKNAEKLVSSVGGTAMRLSELHEYKVGFDVIITCTGSAKEVLTQSIYNQILSDTKTKYIVDLAVPNDVSEQVHKAFAVKYISVDSLKAISEENLLERRKELLKARQIIFDALEDFKKIFEMRQMEIKMRAIPEHVKQIRTKAVTEIFSKEVDQMDEASKEVLDKILNYMEKKYVSVPMIMAKEMLNKTN